MVPPPAARHAACARLTEVVAGAVLLLTALEVLRRRLAGPLGAEHGYEAGLALVSTAALVLAGALLFMFQLLGGRLPSIDPGYSFGSPIALELLLVWLAL